MNLPLNRREWAWYRGSFLLAAVYNTIWGVGVILFPGAAFEAMRVSGVAIEMPSPLGLLLWQCIGMFVLVYAVGYVYLWRDPVRYAPFLLVAVLGKLFGPIGWVYGWWIGVLPAVTGLTIITNDMLWWPLWWAFVWRVMIRGRVAPIS